MISFYSAIAFKQLDGASVSGLDINYTSYFNYTIKIKKIFITLPPGWIGFKCGDMFPVIILFAMLVNEIVKSTYSINKF